MAGALAMKHLNHPNLPNSPNPPNPPDPSNSSNHPNPRAQCNPGAPVTGLPAHYFTDPEFFRRAGERIFFRTWQYACHASELPNAGDFISFSICDQDVFVIRGRDRRLRAFNNVCRHRGHTLLEGGGARKTGRCKTIVCPYHAWSYDLNGTLRAAPNARRVPGFEAARRRIRLGAVAVEAFLGFVFVNLDSNSDPNSDSNSNPNAKPMPMDECYPGVRDAILALCPDIETRAFAHAHSAREECNWVIAVENYNECYHCPTAHPAFAEGIIDPESYDIAPFGGGRCLRHTSRASRSARAWYDLSGSDYGSFYLWPATALQVYPGGVVNSYYWRARSPEETEVHRNWYSADGAVDDSLRGIIDRDRDTTFAEDLRLVKGVQRGVKNRGFIPGPLMIDPAGGIGSERAVATLHGWLRDALDAPSPPPSTPPD